MSQPALIAHDSSAARTPAGCSTAELERAQVPEPPRPLRFAGPALSASAAQSADPLLALHDVRIPGRFVLNGPEVSATDHPLVTGGNGAGKSTLPAVLAGRLTADLPASRWPSNGPRRSRWAPWA